MRNSTEVASSNPTYDEVFSTQQYVINFVSDLRQIGRWFSPVSSINETDHDITEILLKVSLDIKHPLPPFSSSTTFTTILTITLNNRLGITCETATAYPPVHISLIPVFWRDRVAHL